MKLCMSWRKEVTMLIRMAQGAFRSARKGLPLPCLQCTQAQVDPSLRLISLLFIASCSLEHIINLKSRLMAPIIDKLQ